ncbi:gliotoxin biosynthesis protein GliK [Purpureocillium lavendulum]|uniref:Gliotoxin biosynthesis protein GliK n=1 Tax=Purpureocillium lavendulum TaxID=1247861 RepID=A0AB34G234_9HYPO|nr:gliotoxin biosynthesis protein GliK [Purpureocillium lavendulum]
MKSFFSFAFPGSGHGHSSSSSGSHVTEAPPVPRTLIGPATEHLESQMLQLYWDGVKNELPHLILTLRKWQLHAKFADVTLRDERELLIHGYDTFLDQVSHSSRRFGQRHTDRRERQSAPASSGNELPTYEEALENRGWDMFAEMKSNRIREEVRERLENRPIDDFVQRRARMLLQSAQFLDIDKIIEYREPEQLLTFWKRPAPPQVVLSSVDDTKMPVFRPLRCTSCHGVIRGSLFRNIRDNTIAVCEKCYRRDHYGRGEFAKEYKTCCLPKAMTRDVTRHVCRCSAVPHRDAAGKPAELWPLKTELGEPHARGGIGRLNCGLFELSDMVAEAKYSATRIKSERDKTLEEARREDLAGMQEFLEQKRPKKLKNINTTSVSEFGSSYGITMDSPEDVPFYVRSITERYPYGNVHMALRFGPLMIENGVENTHGGVLITTRSPPQLQVLRDPASEEDYSLLITGCTERKLYSQHRPRVVKRYKAMLKQVAGGAFATLLNEAAENDIIETLIQESRDLVDEGISATEKATLLAESVGRLLQKIQIYLAPRVTAYISSIVARLLSPEVDLRWNFQTNNCQMFCDNIIDRDIFGSLFAPHEVAGDTDDPATIPLYLMSFVCRPGAYVKQKAKSKFDVPNGLTEEYLLKFHFGRHDESDLIDTLAEYWYDWGNFEGPVYRYQDVFPWDCTEAYCRYPVKCGDCNISKHILAFPFDSWSIISLHLSRGRELYPQDPQGPFLRGNDNDTAELNHLAPGHMSDQAWFQNRMTVLLAQDTLLTTAAAMSRCGAFRESTLWLHSQDDETQDRLKLGGIHRAQPFSHHFERGAYHQYFVAEWTSLARPLRVREYETLRDWRATRADIGETDDGNDSGGGCGGDKSLGFHEPTKGAGRAPALWM